MQQRGWKGGAVMAGPASCLQAGERLEEMSGRWAWKERPGCRGIASPCQASFQHAGESWGVVLPG